MPLTHSQPIHVPSPSVPCGDQGADDLPVSLGYQESGGRIRDETLNVFQATDSAGVFTSSLLP
jgi:hypothetical protein